MQAYLYIKFICVGGHRARFLNSRGACFLRAELNSREIHHAL